MWSVAIKRIRTGHVEVDRVLAARLSDRRRGMTLIARPSANVRKKVLAFLHELRRLEPDQYYYSAADLHLTILSPFTATIEHERFFAQTEKYLAAVDSAVRKAGPMRIQFAGVTASAGAILIQGFFENEELNDLRDNLRQQLRARRLTGGLDVRYRLETAHMTVARFRAPLCNSKKFAAALEAARQRPFGVTNIRSLSLVKNDWYMTHKTLETIRRYRLASSTSRIK